MKTILIITLVGAALIWIMRAMRRRELEKFRDADAGLLAEMKSELGIVEPEIDSLVSALPQQNVSSEDRHPLDLEAPVFKSMIFNERQRRVLEVLEGILVSRYRVFVNPALSDLMTTNSSLKVSFVICDSQYLKVEAALEFQDQLDETLLGYFSEVPMIAVSEGESKQTLGEKLAAVSEGFVAIPETKQRCPNCYGDMNFKAPKTGKNAGKRFWLCKSYPQCRGVQTL